MVMPLGEIIWAALGFVYYGLMLLILIIVLIISPASWKAWLLKTWLFLCFLPIGGFLLLLSSIPIRDKYRDWKYHIKHQKKMAALAPEISARLQHLAQVCQTDAKLSVYKKIPPNSGLFIHRTAHRMREATPEEQQAIDQCILEINSLNQRYNSKMNTKLVCRNKYLSPPGLFKDDLIADLKAVRNESALNNTFL